MSKSHGFVDIARDRLYYETAGSGTPLLLIQAGVADSQQWDDEFSYFSQEYQVIRYDLRGYGKSKKVTGPFTHLEDLTALIGTLDIQPPFVLMVCSMGRLLSMEYAIENPEKIKTLIMASPGLCGLDLDVAVPKEFSEAKKAFEEGDLKPLAEIETQIWFDSMSQHSGHVDCSMHALLYDMQRSVKSYEGNKIRKRQPALKKTTAECLGVINFPVLIIVGSHDLGYMHAVADYLTEHIPSVQKEISEDAAHLPNMDQPNRFREIVENYLLDLDAGEFPSY